MADRKPERRAAHVARSGLDRRGDAIRDRVGQRVHVDGARARAARGKLVCSAPTPQVDSIGDLARGVEVEVEWIVGGDDRRTGRRAHLRLSHPHGSSLAIVGHAFDPLACGQLVGGVLDPDVLRIRRLELLVRRVERQLAVLHDLSGRMGRC